MKSFVKACRLCVFMVIVLVSCKKTDDYKVGDVWVDGPLSVEVSSEQWEMVDGESGQVMTCFIMRFLPSKVWEHTSFTTIEGLDYTPGYRYRISLFIKNQVVDVLPNGSPVITRSAILNELYEMVQDDQGAEVISDAPCRVSP